MPLDKSVLLGFLKEVGRELERPVVLVAVGGTGLTLLDARYQQQMSILRSPAAITTFSGTP